MENVYIYNLDQALFYIKNKVYPIKTGVHPDTERFYFVFIRKDTQLLYVDWKRQSKKLEII